jgi:hypothetical protein
MEQRFLFGLLMWGEGNLTPNYILFCALGSFGALQFVAGTYARRDLTPFRPPLAQVVGAALVVFAFVWFFAVQPDLFIPGLAGGEFVVYSGIGFLGAYGFARFVAWLANRSANASAVTRASADHSSVSK